MWPGVCTVSARHSEGPLWYRARVSDWRTFAMAAPNLIDRAAAWAWFAGTLQYQRSACDKQYLPERRSSGSKIFAGTALRRVPAPLHPWFYSIFVPKTRRFWYIRYSYLKPGLGGHSSFGTDTCTSIRHLWFPINVPQQPFAHFVGLPFPR